MFVFHPTLTWSLWVCLARSYYPTITQKVEWVDLSPTSKKIELDLILGLTDFDSCDFPAFCAGPPIKYVHSPLETSCFLTLLTHIYVWSMWLNSHHNMPQQLEVCRVEPNSPLSLPTLFISPLPLTPTYFFHKAITVVYCVSFQFFTNT